MRIFLFFSLMSVLCTTEGFAPQQLTLKPKINSVELNALPFLGDSNMEDLIYQAQSTAATIATESINSPSMSVSSLALLYFAGLLTSFSPCAMGLLPLTVSYISNAAGEREDKAVFLPTVAFALGLAAVFCGLGLSVSMLGGVFGSSGNQNFLGAFILGSLSGGISISMGLQLLDLVRLPLPSLDFGDFATSGSGNNGGSSALFRTFLLGGSSALVASPCATPVLTSILAFVAANRDPVLGSILLFTYTVGYSTPLLVVGASGGQALANAQAAAMSEENSVLGVLGNLVNPLIASILIWYGTSGILETFLGDPSLAGLAPVLE